jgi:hypothetical protein
MYANDKENKQTDERQSITEKLEMLQARFD